MRNAYNILVRKPEGKKHLEDNIRMDIKEIGWENVN
jgi:hypothetical protein